MASESRDQELRSLVAQFWRLPPEHVRDDLLFNAQLRNFSSVRFLTFIAAVESNLKVRISDPAAVTSYASLREAVGAAGTTGPVAPVAATGLAVVGASPERGPTSVLSVPALGFALGQDIEEIANLPEAADWLAHPFYSKNFTPTEIAYCAKQADPRQHFAARMCAKEALIKAHRVFEGVGFSAIEVVNDAAGRPSLRVLDERANAALGGSELFVSLSHTGSLASAVVMIAPRGR